MELTLAERMNLMKFVCSFAWTDLSVSQAERDIVMRIAGQLKLNDSEIKRVQGWLEVPPTADEVDPNAVLPEHRQLFLTVAEMVVNADGKVAAAENESLKIFRELLSGN